MSWGINKMETPKQVMERIEKEVNERIAREDIICPYCNHKQDTDTRNHYVTYWGEDGEHTIDCESCDKPFIFEEKVQREFITRKMGVGEKE